VRTLVVPLALVSGVAVLGGCSPGHATKPSDAGSNGSAGATAGSGSAGAAAGASPEDSDGAAGVPGAAASAGSDGGGGSDAGVEAPVDGLGASRLVPWQLEADGTAPLVMGIFDQQEKVHCRFLPDETGQLRCLPVALATFKETAWFSDAACTKRIYVTDAVVGPTWVDRPTALPLPRDACGPYRYVVATLKVSPASAPHFGGAACAQIQPPPDPGFGHAEMTVNEVQSPDRWATGTEVAAGPLIGARMRVNLVEAPDGTRFAADLTDQRWDKPCRLAASADGARCLTNAPGASVGVAGAMCVGPPVWLSHACDDPPFVAASSMQDGLARGAVWSGPVSHGGHGCLKVPGGSTIDGPDVFFEAGATIADAVMAPQPWKAAGTGRLRLRGLVDDGGEVVTPPMPLLLPGGPVLQGGPALYFDSVANTMCNPVRAPDGQLRCVPTTVGLAVNLAGFADDKCTVPVFYCPNYATSCPGILAMKATTQANGEVLAETLNTTRVVTTVFLSPTGTCTPSTFMGPGVFALDAAEPWAQFPAFTERNARGPDDL
jgi:hypothetical protein